jgi:hypothetical protein
MEDTSGFYKLDEETLLYGHNFVIGPGFELRRETHEDHTYPVEGWYWFDSKEEAREFFNLGPEPEPETEVGFDAGFPFALNIPRRP